MSRPTLKDLMLFSIVLRCLFPSCSHRPGWFGLGCSFGGALSHH